MKSLLKCLLSGWALLIGIAVVESPLRAQESGGARAIVVFDASGSMWGEVTGGVKIDIAKKVVAEIISGIDPAMELGLIAYGHRSKGDCADIELLVEPKADSAGEILKAVTELQPKGKTPLTDAVMQAAQFLKFTESKASVILVSDGVETCDRDPCLAAEEMERLGVDFTCHVIGFDLKEGESSDLECLAQKTGGMYLPATDAASLRVSLQAAMKQVVKPSTVLVVEPKKSSGGALIEGVGFQLLGQGEKALATGSGGRWTVELEKPGRYVVSAKLGGKVIEIDADVPEGQTVTKEVVFAETGLKAVAYDTQGGRAFTDGVSWDLFGPADAEGNRRKVAYSYAAQPFLKVAPGQYLLQAKRGSASASVDVVIEDGVPQQVEVILGSGVLKLSAIVVEGAPPLESGLGWDVYGPADVEGNRRKIAYSYSAKPMLTLPSGPCLVTVKYGNASGQAQVEVQAGGVQEVVVTLGSGKLKLAVLMEEGGEPVTQGVGWDVYGPADAEGNRKKIAYSYEAQPVFSLPAGECVVSVKVGNASGSKPFVIEAGGLIEDAIVLGAGKVRFSALAIAGADPLTNGLGWDIFGPADVEGNRQKVGYSYDAQPLMSFPAGAYLAQVTWGNASIQQEITVEAGKLVEIPLVLNAGTAALSAIMGEGADPAPNGLGWDVFGPPDVEGNRRKVGYSYDAQPKFRFLEGTYLVRVNRGNASAEGEIEVKAGTMVSNTLNLNAGIVKASSPAGGGWDLYAPPDAEGNRRKVGYSYDATPTFYLPAGKVLFVRTNGDKRAEKEVVVEANKLIELTLTPQ